MTIARDRIVICACTYKRPDGLTDLFASLANLRVAASMDVSVCIIDNDAEPSSQALVAKLAETLPFPVTYAHEAQPGIPAARNRCIAEAGETGHMVFVDDDETVHRDWLIELTTMRARSKATFVQGPVDMQVALAGDAWWLETVFFRQSEFPDGAARVESWTNNVMIDLEFLTQTGVRFDPALRFDGGSDTLFFQDIIRAGGTGVFAAKAVVHEIQPPSRLTWKWAIHRQYRYGHTRANTALMRRSRISALGYCFVRGGGMMTVGAANLVAGLWRGKRGLADGLAYIARGGGVLMGAFGARKLEYAR